MEQALYVEKLIANLPSIISEFSSGLEVEKFGFMYHVVMEIYHKKTNVVILRNEKLFVSECGYLKDYEDFIHNYFHNVVVCCLTGLCRIRKRPLELHNETYEQACEKFLLERGG